MTCSVAIAHKNRVYMGADSTLGGVEEDPRKLFRAGPALVGISGAPRDAQILEFRAELHPTTGEFVTIGSRGPEARGSLHTTAQIWKSPRKRIDATLDAACELDAWCIPPYHYESI